MYKGLLPFKVKGKLGIAAERHLYWVIMKGLVFALRK
jgi:hypothetical protein